MVTSGVSERKTPWNTDFFQASAIIQFCIVSTMVCSVSISAFKRKNWFTVIPVVTCVAAAPQSCLCRAKAPLLCTNTERQLTSYQKTWCQTSLPEGEGGLEYWAKLLCCSEQLGGEKPMVGCKSVSVLTLHLPGPRLTAFELQADWLCIVTFWWVLCVQGWQRRTGLSSSFTQSLCPSLAEPQGSVWGWGELSHSEHEFFCFVVAQHLQAAATRGQCGYSLEGASQCFLMNTILRQAVLTRWALWRHRLIPASTVSQTLAIHIYLKSKCKIPRRTELEWLSAINTWDVCNSRHCLGNISRIFHGTFTLSYVAVCIHVHTPFFI